MLCLLLHALTSQASAAAVGRAARAAVAGLRPAPPRALVVHLSADTGRVSARYVDLAAAGGALEPIECRAGAVLRHLRPLRARYEPRCAAAADPGEDLLAAARRAIQGEQKALEGALAVVGGKLARGTQLELTMDEFLGSGGSAGGGGLSSAAAKKRGKGKGKGSKGGGGGGRKVADSDGSAAASAAEPLDVELLVPAAAAAAAAAATIGGGVSICGGSIAALSFAHGRETLQQALEDLRADMVGSLRARAELLCEADDDGGDDAGDRAEEEENDPPATVVPETPRRLALPRRCAVPWHAPLLAIDHAAEGEGEEDVLERCQDMLGFADEGEARQVEWLERPADTASAVAARQPEAKGDGLDDDDGGGGASAAATGGKSASWMPLLGAAAAAFTAAFAALDMNDDGAFNLSPLIS